MRRICSFVFNNKDAAWINDVLILIFITEKRCMVTYLKTNSLIKQCKGSLILLCILFFKSAFLLLFYFEKHWFTCSPLIFPPHIFHLFVAVSSWSLDITCQSQFSLFFFLLLTWILNFLTPLHQNSVYRNVDDIIWLVSAPPPHPSPPFQTCLVFS